MQNGAAVVSFPSTGGADVSIRTLDPAACVYTNGGMPPPQPSVYR